jgi:hypothetical protein
VVGVSTIATTTTVLLALILDASFVHTAIERNFLLVHFFRLAVQFRISVRGSELV